MRIKMICYRFDQTHEQEAAGKDENSAASHPKA